MSDCKPILFNSEMVRAILEGRKTQTRRVLKHQPEEIGGDVFAYGNEFFIGSEVMQDYLFHEVYGVKGSRYGSVYSDGTSDTLWVRETWACIGAEDIKPSDIAPGYTVKYRADKDDEDWRVEKWRPSIFMPRWASRISLKVTDVRVERVQEITESDCIKEGVPSHYSNFSDGISMWSESQNVYFRGTTYKSVFSQLWDSINAKRGYGWDTNPWVWVIEFERAT